MVSEDGLWSLIYIATAQSANVGDVVTPRKGGPVYTIVGTVPIHRATFRQDILVSDRGLPPVAVSVRELNARWVEKRPARSATLHE